LLLLQTCADLREAAPSSSSSSSPFPVQVAHSFLPK
jgi:hypothetical protein